MRFIDVKRQKMGLKYYVKAAFRIILVAENAAEEVQMKMRRVCVCLCVHLCVCVWRRHTPWERWSATGLDHSDLIRFPQACNIVIPHSFRNTAAAAGSYGGSCLYKDERGWLISKSTGHWVFHQPAGVGRRTALLNGGWLPGREAGCRFAKVNVGFYSQGWKN